jgi:hypothetical protein
VDSYRDYLMRAFGFEQGLERARSLVSFLSTVTSHARSKSPVSAEQVETIADALGWLFVSERVAFAHGMVFHQLDADDSQDSNDVLRSLTVTTGTQASAGKERRLGVARIAHDQDLPPTTGARE